MAEPVATRPRELEELVALLRERLPDLERRYGVTGLAVFGSSVRGDARPDSDIDILVDFVTPPSLFRLVALEGELSALLGRPVDLVPKRALKPRIAGRVLAEAVPV